MVKIIKEARMEHLEDFIQFVLAGAKDHGFPEKKMKEIELATEEAVVNVINYAYDDNTGNIEITCKPEGDKDFEIEIIDSGRPFNVLSVKGPDLTSDIEDRSIGGLGVFFMKQFMDDVKYRREDGKNVLTFIIQRNE